MTIVINGAKYNSWSHINWTKINRVINNLQRRIFVAKQNGSLRTLRKLQNLLLSARSNKYRAVNQVSRVSLGMSIFSVTNKAFHYYYERSELISLINRISLKKWEPVPNKLICIEKSHSTLRSLSIPILVDRALQIIVKTALEPEWEVVFKASKHSFRRFPSSKDAMHYIRSVCNSKTPKRWIVEMDIKSYFDRITSKYLLKKVVSFPAQKLIQRWIKAGYLSAHPFHGSLLGPCQGDIIRPILVNVFLHGMQDVLCSTFGALNGATTTSTLIECNGEYTVACQSQKEALLIKNSFVNWTRQFGLGISAERIRVVHLHEGFDFLGFNVRLYTLGSKEKFLLTPSKQSLLKLRYKLKALWKASLGFPVIRAVFKINSVIKSWVQYFKIGISSDFFSTLDHYMWIRQYRFSKRTHPRKSWDWIRSRYLSRCFCADKKDEWVFGCKGASTYMQKFSWFFTKPHVVVRGTSVSFYSDVNYRGSYR